MKILQDSLYKISDAYSRYQYSQASLRSVRASFHNIPDSTLDSLTKEEKKMINDKWKGVCPQPSIGYHAFRVFKKYDEFNVNYVPEPFFYPYIVRILNPTQDFVSLTHKGLIDSLFSNMNRPETLVKSYDNSYLTNNYDSIDLSLIPNYLLSQNCDLIIKPAKDSNSGRGISIIKQENTPKQLYDIITSFPTDFVIQKIVNQSDFTSQFNKTSLNSFRVISLYLNGKCSICAVILKVGAPGRFVDNGASGGLWIGVRNDGTLNNWGINFDGVIRKEHNGISFNDKQVPNYPGIVSFAKQAHAHIPMCGIVGWDIALNNNNAPVLIEANLWWPIVSYGQICSGPIFGSRTDEVIEYVRSHELKKLGFRHSI